MSQRELLLVQNVVALSAHAVLHDLTRLRAGIGARGATVAAGGGNHTDPPHPFWLHWTPNHR